MDIVNVKDIVLKNLDCLCKIKDTNKILTTKLKDLGLDQLDILELIIVVEDMIRVASNVSITVENENIVKMVTVGDMISEFEKLLK